MTDVEKREKVIRGLEACAGVVKADCKNCPYAHDDMDEVCLSYTLMRDALSILKEQEEEMQYLKTRLRLNAEYGLREPTKEEKNAEN